jgi:hypothetical protein
MRPDVLERALTEPGPPPLPADVAALLRELAAPPRLAAHLRMVHEAALALVAGIAARFPALGPATCTKRPDTGCCAIGGSPRNAPASPVPTKSFVIPTERDR